MENITTQPINQSYNATVITEQPSVITTKIQHTKELEINSLTRAFDQRELQFFKATNSYLAYSQQVRCTDQLKLRNLLHCKSPCIDDCYSGNQLTIVYPDETIEKININPSYFSSKDIAFDSNDSAIIALNNSKENSSLSLIKLKEFRQGLPSTDKKITIKLPQENIRAATISSNNHLHTTGIENNNLCIWTSNITLENHTSEEVNWQQLHINLLSDSISDVAFSENSRYLFVRLKTSVLNVYDGNQTWEKIAEITGTTTFPVDISEDINNTLMIFLENKELIIKSDKNDIFYCDGFYNKLTTACFIPNTKDALIFDSTGNIMLVKNENIVDGDLPVKEYYPTKIPYTISNIYFDPANNKKLAVLAEKQDNGNIKIYFCCAITGSILGSTTYCCAAKKLICCTASCASVSLLTCSMGVIMDFAIGTNKGFPIKCMPIKKAMTISKHVEQTALNTIKHTVTK
jgi:hypothetical protein